MGNTNNTDIISCKTNNTLYMHLRLTTYVCSYAIAQISGKILYEH